MSPKNCMVAQSGGPTVAINASLAGVIDGVMRSDMYDTVYGSLNGITGILNNDLTNLSELMQQNSEYLDRLKVTPAMYLGSCRYKLPNKKLTFKSQIPGAAICGVAWYIFSIGVSIYVDYFNGFSMYGSLTTIALIMLWLYFCMYIMMMSAEVNVIFNDSIRKWLIKEKEKKKRKNS